MRDINHMDGVEQMLRTRRGYKVFKGVCLRKCANRGMKCKTCLGYRNYLEIKK